MSVNEALLIHRHKPTLNNTKEAYEMLIFTRIMTRVRLETATSLPKLLKTIENLSGVVGRRVSVIT